MNSSSAEQLTYSIDKKQQKQHQKATRRREKQQQQEEEEEEKESNVERKKTKKNNMRGKHQQSAVDEKYAQWKSLVPVLYDWLANHNLVWPSLSCRYFLFSFFDFRVSDSQFLV